ncbi:hypothetical protein [Spiroplasma diminutum]|uniref:Uncharacterized protein n=1 Tax=Spiroplasma diminutum CUAS-1 TaxID=1276221 RepID=S5M1C6_9MOLU|nr:hypothetical protein [Spiroplasma diminutum]AGR41842.1 hypothetical protein SDIMI_v3c01380 [Spiroplasma diminutum CUAS-1]
MLKIFLSMLNITATNQVQTIVQISNLNIQNFISTYKLNVNTLNVEPLNIKLVNEEDDLEVIRGEVFSELITQNENNEIIEEIPMSMLFQPEEWKFQSMNYKKPNEGETLIYNSKSIATPGNIRYSGVFKFTVFLKNKKNVTIPEEISLSGENNDIVVDTIIDTKDRWKGKNGELINIKLNKYGINNKKDLESNYSQVNINYNFKHEDNSRHGAGVIQNSTNVTKTLSLKDVLAHNKFTYPDYIYDEQTEKIYDDHWELKFENGLIERYKKQYTQNKIWAFYVIDTIYSEQSNSISIRSTTIAGKWRSGANQANVHSKLTTKINKITIK